MSGARFQEYYASWCGHCQHFAPTYEAFAREAAKAVPTLTVAAMNCASHDALCKDRHVNSFPTIYLCGTAPPPRPPATAPQRRLQYGACAHTRTRARTTLTHDFILRLRSRLQVPGRAPVRGR